MESDADKLERLMVIVKDITGYADHKHSLDSRIARDLGCEGSDAEELLQRMQDELGVDFSDFDFYEYFVDEMMCCQGWMFWWLYGSWHLYRLNFKTKTEITVRDLYDAVLRGKWIHPASK